MKLQRIKRLFIPVLTLGLVAILSTANVLAADLALEEGLSIEGENIGFESTNTGIPAGIIAIQGAPIGVTINDIFENVPPVNVSVGTTVIMLVDAEGNHIREVLFAPHPDATAQRFEDHLSGWDAQGGLGQSLTLTYEGFTTTVSAFVRVFSNYHLQVPNITIPVGGATSVEGNIVNLVNNPTANLYGADGTLYTQLTINNLINNYNVTGGRDQGFLSSFDYMTPGVHEVTFQLRGYTAFWFGPHTASFTITVVEEEAVSIGLDRTPDFVLHNPNGWHDVWGGGFGFPSFISLLDENGEILSSVRVTEDMVSGYDRTVVGVQEVTISYLGLTYTFTIEVVEIILVVPPMTLTTSNVITDIEREMRRSFRAYDANNPTRLLPLDSGIHFGMSSGMFFHFYGMAFEPERWPVNSDNTLRQGVWQIQARFERAEDHEFFYVFTLTVLGDEPPYEGNNDNNNNNNNDNNYDTNGSTNNNQSNDGGGNQQIAPQTGDTTGLAGFVVLALQSLLLLGFAAHMKRKRVIL